MAFNNKANTIVIKKGPTTPPDNFLWLRTNLNGKPLGLYKNIGEDTWVPYDVNGGNSGDLTEVNEKINNILDSIKDIKNSKQDNITIATNDKILSLNDATLLSELELVYIKEDKAIYLRGKGGKIINKVSVEDFINDGLIENVEYDSEKHILKIIFNTDHNQKVPIEIDLNDLADVYTAGYGLVLKGGEFSIDQDIVALVTNLEKVSQNLNIKIEDIEKTLGNYETNVNQKIEDFSTRIDKIEKDYKEADTNLLNLINQTKGLMSWTNFE